MRYFIPIILLFVIAFLGCEQETVLPILEKNHNLGDMISLKNQEAASIVSENMHLTFKAVTDESRCPETWSCLWAGETVLLLEAQKGDIKEVLKIVLPAKSAPVTATFLNYQLLFNKITPYPTEQFYTKKPLDFSAYTINFSVKNDKSLLPLVAEP